MAEQDMVTAVVAPEEESDTKQKLFVATDPLTLEELTAKLKANPEAWATEDEVRPLVETEFPAEDAFPQADDMDESVLETNEAMGLPFRTGQWIERLGNDMLWHLEPIRRTVRLADNDGKWEYFYKTSSGLMYKANEVRAPAEALQRHFGMRPFLWQQYCFYKIEKYVRFQENHERDFVVVDYVKSAEIFFEEWLHHPKNQDFLALFNSKASHCQQKLKTHLLSPFQLMNDIMREKEGVWEMKDANVSVYQYSSFLGSGWFTSLIVLFVQLVVPFLLFIYQVRESGRFPRYNEGNVSSVDFATIFDTDFETFCFQPVPIDSVIINFVVFVVYTIRVVPVVFDSFYSTVGDAPSLNSRLNSLRIIIWDQGDDTTWQQLGFKLDRYMNSVYIALINSLMLIILFLTESTVDVILNALAIDFLYDFDRDVPRSAWYDHGYRFLKAAILEIQVRGEIFLERVHNSDLLCKVYDIDKTEYKAKVGGPLFDNKVADKDSVNPKYMSVKDKIWIASSRVARELDRKEALWQFEEQVATFGFGDWLHHHIFKSSGGIFNRYHACDTWSRWEEALFLPRVPQIGQVSTFEGIPSVREAKLLKQIATGGAPASTFTLRSSSRLLSGAGAKERLSALRYVNFDESSTWDAFPRFMNALLKTLKFETLVQGVRTVIRRGKYHHVPFRVIDGMFEWLSFIFLMVVFPLWLMCYAVLVLGCQPVA